MNTALMPVPVMQFSDANGIPLAGGKVLTYAAGTTTPLATYQDSLGATPNTNPVILNSAGEAAIWLSSAAYKIVLTDVNNVVQWTADNVTAVSQTELAGNSTFASITVTGNALVQGALEVDGALSGAAGTFSGALTAATLVAAAATIAGGGSFGGALSALSQAVTNNETVGGALTVTGAAAVGSLTVGGVAINTLITSLIPAITALAGTLVVTDVSTAGNWVIFTFGATAGTRIRIALGSGSGVATGGTIALPGGFSSTNLKAHVSIDAVAATAGNQLSQFTCSQTAGVVSVAAADSSGHNFTPTASWFGVTWLVGY